MSTFTLSEIPEEEKIKALRDVIGAFDFMVPIRVLYGTVITGALPSVINASDLIDFSSSFLVDSIGN